MQLGEPNLTRHGQLAFQFDRFLKSCENGSAGGKANNSLKDWFFQAKAIVKKFLLDDDLLDHRSLYQPFLMGMLAQKEGELAMGRVFYSGYQAAIKGLFDLPDDDRLYSYCVTESEGNGPKQIQTLLRGHGGFRSMTGRKTFVTSPDIATDFMVVCSEGWLDERNRIKVVHCRKPESGFGEGVKLDVFPALPFIPEIKHGSLLLSEVAVPEESVFEGEGYESYVRPFRWCEDLCVFAASFGYLCAVALTVGNRKVMHRLVLLSATLLSLDPKVDDEASHMVFAGLQEVFLEMRPGLSDMMVQAGTEINDMWLRDLKLFDVANAARKKRAEMAWQSLV